MTTLPAHKRYTFNVASFSGGHSSALTTLIAYRLYLDSDIEVIYCNTGLEHEDTLRFVNEFSNYFSIPITWLEFSGLQSEPHIVSFKTASRDGSPFIKLVREKGMLPNRVTRFCTSELKIKTIKRYLKTKGILNYNSILGIRYDEGHRWSRLMANQDKDVFDYLMPLYDLQVTNEHVKKFWNNQPVHLFIPHFMGNCTLCFNKGKGNLVQALKHPGNLVDIWNSMEIETSSTFSNRYSIASLKSLSLDQCSLFPIDYIDVPCQCNAD